MDTKQSDIARYNLYGNRYDTYIGTVEIDNINDEAIVTLIDNIKYLEEIPGALILKYRNGQRQFNTEEFIKDLELYLMTENRVNAKELLASIGLEKYSLLQIIQRIKMDWPVPYRIEPIK